MTDATQLQLETLLTIQIEHCETIREMKKRRNAELAARIMWSFSDKSAPDGFESRQIESNFRSLKCGDRYRRTVDEVNSIKAPWISCAAHNFPSAIRLTSFTSDASVNFISSLRFPRPNSIRTKIVFNIIGRENWLTNRSQPIGSPTADERNKQKIEFHIHKTVQLSMQIELKRQPARVGIVNNPSDERPTCNEAQSWLDCWTGSSMKKFLIFIDRFLSEFDQNWKWIWSGNKKRSLI